MFIFHSENCISVKVKKELFALIFFKIHFITLYANTLEEVKYVGHIGDHVKTFFPKTTHSA